MALIPEINHTLAFYSGSAHAWLLDCDFKQKVTQKKVSEIKCASTGNDKSLYPSVLSGMDIRKTYDSVQSRAMWRSSFFLTHAFFNIQQNIVLWELQMEKKLENSCLGNCTFENDT